MNPSCTKLGSASAPAGAAVRAKAYCGPAHGQSWGLDSARPVPDRVHLDAAGQVHCYELVRDLRLRRAARDHHGNYLYLPAGHSTAPGISVPPPTADVRHPAQDDPDPLRLTRQA